jgi:hypothetical protein
MKRLGGYRRRAEFADDADEPRERVRRVRANAIVNPGRLAGVVRIGCDFCELYWRHPLVGMIAYFIL